MVPRFEQEFMDYKILKQPNPLRIYIIYKLSGDSFKIRELELVF